MFIYFPLKNRYLLKRIMLILIWRYWYWVYDIREPLTFKVVRQYWHFFCSIYRRAFDRMFFLGWLIQWTMRGCSLWERFDCRCHELKGWFLEIYQWGATRDDGLFRQLTIRFGSFFRGRMNILISETNSRRRVVFCWRRGWSIWDFWRVICEN